MGKHHPDLYKALDEFRKEQAHKESMQAEYSLGKAIRIQPKKNVWISRKELKRYWYYKDGNRRIDYVWTIGHNITL